MADNTTSLKAMMEMILAHLDEQKVDSDKRLEAQIAFKTQVSQDLRSLSKQVYLTQADVDETRKALERSPSPSESHSPTVLHPPPPPPPRPQAPAPQHQHGSPPSPRLLDQRPPLLATAPQPGVQSQHQQYHQIGEAHHQQQHHGDHYVKPPKHDFPRFDGSAPYLWLDRCRAYFDLYHVPPSSWVTTATLYIKGQAAHWLHAFRQTHGGLGWDAFCTAITEEFGVNEFEMEMHKLLQLRQIGTVSE